MPQTPSATTQKTQKTQPVTAAAASATPAKADALLKADHRKVEGLFAQYEKTEDTAQKRKLALQVCKELIVHARLEEEIFYSACREKDVEDDMLDEAQVEHDGAKTLISELIAGSPEEEFYDAKVKVLCEYIKHHVGEEEKPRDGIFAKAQKAGVDMAALGQKIQARKQQLVTEIDENRLEPPQPRSLTHYPQGNLQESTNMPRNSNDRDRDNRGRFIGDDDDYRGRSSSRGGYSSRGADDEDDDRRGYSSRGGNDRDERGRFTGENGNGGSSGRGWYGDSEGLSQAARTVRGGSRSRDEDDDDRRSGYSLHSGGGRDERGRFMSDDDDDRRSSSRGGYSSRSSNDRDRDDRGRFMRDDDDDRRGSQSSRGGYSSRSSNDRDRDDRGRFMSDDDDDRRGRSSSSRDEGRGWHGDSQAAREGWENRGSSRGRDDDDDRGGRSSGRDEGHGGWFGDSRGHAQAARRGWQNRD